MKFYSYYSKLIIHNTYELRKQYFINYIIILNTYMKGFLSKIKIVFILVYSSMFLQRSFWVFVTKFVRIRKTLILRNYVQIVSYELFNLCCFTSFQTL
jgi:hypothetical protein